MVAFFLKNLELMCLKISLNSVVPFRFSRFFVTLHFKWISAGG